MTLSRNCVCKHIAYNTTVRLPGDPKAKQNTHTFLLAYICMSLSLSLSWVSITTFRGTGLSTHGFYSSCQHIMKFTSCLHSCFFWAMTLSMFVICIYVYNYSMSSLIFIAKYMCVWLSITSCTLFDILRWPHSNWIYLTGLTNQAQIFFLNNSKCFKYIAKFLFFKNLSLGLFRLLFSPKIHFLFYFF